MSLFLSMIYAVRENALRMRSKEASDISMNSAFAEYVKTLFDDYGLIFVDAGYMTKTRSMILAEERFKDCMNANFDEKADIPVWGKDLLKLDCTSAETLNVRFATDNKGLALRRQAAEYMHYHTKVQYAVDLYDSLTDVNDIEFTSTGLQDQVDSAMSGLRGYAGDYEVAEWTDWQYGAVISNKEVSPFTVLSLVVPSFSDVSTKVLDTSKCVSHRELNKGNYAKPEELGPVDSVLFKEYLIEKCADYTTENAETALSYEVEYLINGKGSDARNLAGIVHRILLIREAVNYQQIYRDPVKMGIIRLVANAVAWLLMEPEIAEPLAKMIVAGWAYHESLKDVRVLLRGGRVPLLKDSTDFYTNMYGSDSGEAITEKGLSYRDYLRAFILTANNGKLTERFMDLLELSVRKKDGNNSFRLDMCFDAWAVRAYVTSKYGYDYVIERNKEM